VIEIVHFSYALENIAYILFREYLYDAYSERDNIPLAK
jgi:hypothetical protein